MLNSFYTSKSLLIALLLFSTSSSAQIAAWDFTGQSNIASLSATSSGINLASVPNLTRGSAASASAGSNSFRTTGFQNNGIAIANTDYFQTTLKAATGYTLSLSTIDAIFAGSQTFYAAPGVSSQFAYSTDGTNFTLIGTPTISASATSTTFAIPTINVGSITALQNVPTTTTITIRYYASGQTTTGGWGFNSPGTGSLGFAIGGALTAVSTCASPTLSTTTAVSNITSTTADITGTINGVGGGTNITSRGIQYSTSNSLLSPTSNNEAGTFSIGNFSRSLTGLAANTDYYYRAAAVNDCAIPQTGYSHTLSYPSFTTQPGATTTSTGTITHDGFAVNWAAASGNAASTTYTLEVDDDNTFATPVQTQAGLTGISYSVSALTPLTNYYYRLRVVNASGASPWSAITGPVSTTAFVPYTPSVADWRVRSGITYAGINFSNQWERFNGTIWQTVTGSPFSPGGSTISRLIVNTYVDASANASTHTGLNFDIVVVSGGEFAVLDNAAGALSAVPSYFSGNKTITVQSGGKFTIQGDFKIPAGSSLIAENGATIEIDQASISTAHPMWGGTENFKNGSTVIVKDLNFTTGLVNSTAFSTNTGGYLFGNLEIALAANTGDWSITEGAAGNFNLCESDLTISNTGSKRISLLANTGAVTINGNLYNNGGSFALGSQLSTGSGTQTINVNGNLEIDGVNYLKYNTSASFANYYATAVNLKGNLAVYGTFTDGPIFSASSSTLPLLTMNGTTAQTVDAVATLDFSRMAINKTGGNITLNVPLTIKNNIVLTKGIINTTATNILTIVDNATATGASDNSFVNGPVAKIGNDAIEFPIGKSGKYRPAAISAPSSNLDVYTAEYFSNGHPVTAVNAPLHHISTKEYWDIARTGSGAVDVTLTWNNQSAVNEALELSMAHFNNVSWDDLGTSGLTVNTTTDRITKTGVTTFSPFTIGTSNIAQPLPIRIVRFDAVKVEGNAIISYLVEDVSEGDAISIERSTDGYSFKAIHLVVADKKGALAGQYTDAIKSAQSVFYRLAVKGVNGELAYSNTIVRTNGPDAVDVQMYPNPSGDRLYIKWANASTPVELSVYNSAGAIMLAQTIRDKLATTVDLTPFASGTYIVNWRQGSNAGQQKLEISR